ncbi:MAG: hypothetical protein NC548_31375 [Lachnospiraceae bacterium]|nr:hypothetical protein [Bacteroides fragilis]MCM1219006.1 hypothetical protein [Lachnospiraceae bacterium]
MQYEEVVKMIEESEKRVDEVLKAARLDRHEKVPMSTERLKMLIEYGLMALGMILIFGFFFTLFYLCR